MEKWGVLYVTDDTQERFSGCLQPERSFFRVPGLEKR